MSAPSASVRDARLDLFRGLTMLVIFIAHVPANGWNDFIPARFGFSSGAEVFVFCSGLASALAFGGVFTRRGWRLGTARIFRRMWEVYRAHIGLALTLIALAAATDRWAGSSYLSTQFAPLLRDPAGALFGLTTLTWLPDFLDILPVYLFILALVPAMMALRRLHPALPFFLSALLYALVWTRGLNLPGNPWTGAVWFLNPFAWQAMFFIGFFLGMGWLPAPKLADRRLTVASAALLVLAAPLSHWFILENVPALAALRGLLFGEAEKTDLHPLRILHLLAFAYVALGLIEWRRPDPTRAPARWLTVIGRQSLATFLAGMALARLAGVALDHIGRDVWSTAATNLAGFVAIFCVAVVVGWFKSEPWRKRPEPATRPAPKPEPAADPDMPLAPARPA